MNRPQDIGERTFTKALRGYTPAEVDEYISELTTQISELQNRASELEREREYLTAQNNQLKKTNATPKQILEEARQMASEIIKNANDEAAIIIASSKTSCDNLLNRFRFKIGEERDKLVQLQNAVHDFKTALYTAYQEHINSVEEIVDEADFEELDLEAKGYSEQVVADIKTEVAYLVAELNNKRESDEHKKIADEYFEKRAEELEAELEAERQSQAEKAAETVVFNPDIDLSDLPDDMEQGDESDITVEIFEDNSYDEPQEETVVEEYTEPEELTETEVPEAPDDTKKNYDDLLEEFAEEIKSEEE